MRNHIIITFLLCSLTALTPAASRPNIITILVDDMGFSDLGCYGGEIPTPHLDALAAGGLRYKQFYNNARCCPTRASLLTGVHPHQAGVGHMAGKETAFPGYRGHLDERAMTAAQALQPNGYFTAMVGKWHVGHEPGSNPWERGFERSLSAVAGGFYFQNDEKAKLFLNGQPVVSDGSNLPAQWYSTDLWTKFSLRFIDEAKAANKPFYLYLAHNAPHFPLQAPAEDIAKFRGRYKAGWDKLGADRHAKQKAIGLIDSEWTVTPRPAQIQAWDSLSAEQQEKMDHLMAVYAACISRMDTAVGDLVSGLKERGQLDNTLIFFMSDNGGNAESGPDGRMPGDPSQAASGWFCGESWAFLQNTPFRLYKHYTHEGGIASPLIVHWPAGISAKNEWRNDPAQLIDIVATIADVSGITFPTTLNGKPVLPLEGKSIVPTFRGQPVASPPRTFYWEHEGNAAVREGDLKLVRKGKTGPWELFDLKTDRTEQTDLASKQPEQVKALATKWEAWAQRALVLPQPNSAKEGGEQAPKKGKRGSSATKFQLKPDADLQAEASPEIAGKAFTLTVQIAKPGNEGVVAAQGGSNLGWSLFFQVGKLHFLINQEGQRKEVVSEDPALASATEVTASIGPKGLAKLFIKDRELARKNLGLLPGQPIDGLQLGRDLLGPVGEYKTPFPFNGELSGATLEVGSGSGHE
jgi:arylsulfatase A-like enzyme